LGSCFAQNDLTKIDSLNKLVDVQTGKERIETLISLSEAYRKVSFDKSIKAGSDAEKYANEERLDTLKGQILLSMGESASISGDYALALDYFNKALLSFQNSVNYSALGETYNKMGLVYKNMANFPKAIESYEKASDIYKKYNLDKQLAGSSSNIGNVYFSQGNLSKALDYYYQARLVYKELKDTLRYAKLTMNMGLVYWQWNKNQLALDMHLEVIPIFERKKDFLELGRALNNIGMMYYQDVKDTVKALEYYEQSLEIRNLMGNQLGMATVLSNIGNVYRDKGMMEEAFERYDKAMKISETIGYKEGIVRVYYYMAAAYHKSNNYKESNRILDLCLKMSNEYGLKNYYGIVNEYKLKNYAGLGDFSGFMDEFVIYSATKDSLAADLNEMTTKETEGRFKINELLPEIERLEVENSRQQRSINLYQYSLICLLVVGIISILFVMLRRKKHLYLNH
jgi:tetratricopeptide (TPR) repeat protein